METVLSSVGALLIMVALFALVFFGTTRARNFDQARYYGEHGKILFFDEFDNYGKFVLPKAKLRARYLKSLTELGFENGKQGVPSALSKLPVSKVQDAEANAAFEKGYSEGKQALQAAHRSAAGLKV